ncbi:hypothetical protein quinque_014252 [Culex quinquefasciatus]
MDWGENLLRETWTGIQEDAICHGATLRETLSDGRIDNADVGIWKEKSNGTAEQEEDLNNQAQIGPWTEDRDEMTQWPIKFSGDQKVMSVEEFVKRVEVLAGNNQVSDEELLRKANFLFKSESVAETWYYTFSHKFASWQMLKHQLRLRFETPNKEKDWYRPHFAFMRPENLTVEMLSDLCHELDKSVYRTYAPRPRPYQVNCMEEEGAYAYPPDEEPYGEEVNALSRSRPRRFARPEQGEPNQNAPETENNIICWNCQEDLSLELPAVELPSQQPIGSVETEHTLSPAEHRKLLAVVHKLKGNGKLGRTHVLEHKVEILEGERPKKPPRYRVSPAIQKEMDKEIERMKELDVIEESDSDWCNPLLPVRKSSGEWRLCLDCRRVNEVTKRRRIRSRTCR